MQDLRIHAGTLLSCIGCVWDLKYVYVLVGFAATNLRFWIGCSNMLLKSNLFIFRIHESNSSSLFQFQLDHQACLSSFQILFDLNIRGGVMES